MGSGQTLMQNKHQGSRDQKQEQPLSENILSVRPYNPVDKFIYVEDEVISKWQQCVFK